MGTLSLFGQHHLEVFTSLMHKSMDLLLLGTIAQNSTLYGNGYVSEIQQYSPFSFSYIQRHQDHFVPYNRFLLTAIEAIAFNEYMPA